MLTYRKYQHDKDCTKHSSDIPLQLNLEVYISYPGMLVDHSHSHNSQVLPSDF